MKTEITANEVICLFEGRLDTLLAQVAEPEVDAQTDPGKTLIFDFAGVDYISSTFLRICLKKYKELGADKFYIRNLKPDIKKVFKIAGLEQLIKD